MIIVKGVSGPLLDCSDGSVCIQDSVKMESVSMKLEIIVLTETAVPTMMFVSKGNSKIWLWISNCVESCTPLNPCFTAACVANECFKTPKSCQANSTCVEYACNIASGQC